VIAKGKYRMALVFAVERSKRLLPPIAAVVSGGTRIFSGRGTFLGTIVSVIFDSAAAIDIVSGADARGWPTNHLRNCPHCDVAAVRERGALNNEMEKDKRSYRRARDAAFHEWTRH
jgi:hypothetical protein